ncbi:transglutaminase-like cysteine peptidase [Marinivivus vitaminiproducens]|uniref:transglutaminase-like cysteine peptidase n=1 Tax=Marinivivus vitaminiproducens TaxID=3035935 RepID=UPI00279F803C|nr:transglutaminase-like cysteine peptidase [Geminicoccaceae bacterium SCSIO 64248]
MVPWLAAFALVFVAFLPGTARAADGVFGTSAFQLASLDGPTEWRRVLAAIADERRRYVACDRDRALCGSKGLVAWRGLIAELRGKRRTAQVVAVNAFFNASRYIPDQVNWGRSDYWATPLEFFRRSGDCEDYAIVKYVTLRELGFAPEDLRIVVLRDTKRDVVHAVLSLATGDGYQILDNLYADVLNDRRLDSYVPYYSVNEESRWVHAAPRQERIAGIERAVRPAAQQRLAHDRR